MRQVSKNKLLVRRLVITQLVLVIVLPLLCLMISRVTSYSVLIGALIYFVPNMYFVYRAFKYSGARSANLILRSFYAGESIKLFMTAILFGLTFAIVEPISVLALFAGFIAIQATSWLTPLLTIRKNG